MFNNEKTYTVSQLCRETRLLLEGHFLTVLIEGEISNISRPASGHIYFTLKDQQAQIQCAMFRPQLRQIGFKPENGAHVRLKARVSLYEARGNFQLIAEHMEAAGEGLLRQQFDALKNKLASEGLFDSQTKKTLPSLIKKLGLITSPSGAAIHDVLSVLKSRFPGLAVVIYPVSVQGEAAKHEIVEAIELANARKECDALILTRGGGSIEDLWAFNEENVARAVYQSDIPIVSAIGHETDFSMTDFVADYRAATPSAAAELVSPEQQQWFNQFDQLAKQLARLINNQLASQHVRLDRLQQLLKRTHPGSQLQLHSQRLDESQMRLLNSVNRQLQSYRSLVTQLNASLLSNTPKRSIQQLQHRLDNLAHRLPQQIQQSLQFARLRFASYNKALDALSPLATLSRGYSITKQHGSGAIINKVNQLVIGDKFDVQLSDGTLLATLDKIHDNT
ncbi:MAG: exodeoxyribonuclease VII large subunit [Cycloclasticus sp.]|nr:exodeoxyribonuclease VII large subunit [Cycloclasticus sp.]MBQ0790171.1 exodeoxyribonuclease VII large subunit [Cycloclasticus sp.]